MYPLGPFSLILGLNLHSNESFVSGLIINFISKNELNQLLFQSMIYFLIQIQSLLTEMFLVVLMPCLFNKFNCKVGYRFFGQRDAK